MSSLTKEAFSILYSHMIHLLHCIFNVCIAKEKGNWKRKTYSIFHLHIPDTHFEQFAICSWKIFFNFLQFPKYESGVQLSEECPMSTKINIPSWLIQQNNISNITCV